MQAWRKPGLEVVAKAFLAEGLEGAYRAFAALPHTEAEYDERFKFNAGVTKICYKDDVACSGVHFEDEPLLFVSASSSAHTYPHSLHSFCICAQRTLIGPVQAVRTVACLLIHIPGELLRGIERCLELVSALHPSRTAS